MTWGFFANYPISHAHASPPITSSASKVPQMMETQRLECRSSSDSPTILLSRISESAFQSPATNAMSSASIATQSMIRRIGIMWECSNPCFLKNSWDSALILSVSRVMRLKFFRFAKSST